MRIFVTGGTGLLGNTVLRQLSRSGHELLALVRDEPNAEVFHDIQTEFIRGDLASAEVIDRAVFQSDVVIHVAGLIHLGWSKLDESMRVNRDGTRAIVDACLRYGRRLVHVGTVNTLAVGTRHQPADESTPLDNAGGQVPCSYVVSKRAGVAEVQRGIEQGLRAVIVHPGFMLGPWDWKPSSGRMVLEVTRGWKPLAASGGCSVCDVRDVAAGTIAAVDAEVENGRQFILGGENQTYLELWSGMAEGMGSRKPLIRAGPLQRWIAAAAGDLWAKCSGDEPDWNSAGIRMSSQFHWHDSSRARKELGYHARPARETLHDAVQWLKAHHRPAAGG